jgi:hypothetical protein
MHWISELLKVLCHSTWIRRLRWVPAAMIWVYCDVHKTQNTWGPWIQQPVPLATDFPTPVHPLYGKNWICSVSCPGSSSCFPFGTHILELLAQPNCFQLSRKILTRFPAFSLKAKGSLLAVVSTERSKLVFKGSMLCRHAEFFQVPYCWHNTSFTEDSSLNE